MARPKKENAKIYDHPDMMEAPGLPKKDLFRVDEVADYFDVTRRTIELWIQHGHLEAFKKCGIVRVPRESILKCKFNREKKSA